MLRKTGKAPYDEAFMCDVMKQTLRALAFMHKKPFLHKDVFASWLYPCENQEKS